MTIINGTNSSDTLSGSSGDDTIYGWNGDDTINAGAGNDTLVGGAGADTIDGGSGFDSADYGGSISAITVNLVSNVNHGGDAEGDMLTNIEEIDGSNFSDNISLDNNDNVVWARGGDDVVYAWGGNDVIHGQDGNDTIDGGAGNDALYGDNGDDVLAGGQGADILDGGAGCNWADYANSNAGVSVNLSSGVGTGGDAAGDALSHIQNLLGSANADTFYGDGGANVFYGRDGNDSLDGGDGGDFLYGQNGNDALTGGAGADYLDGGAGSDTADYATAATAVSVNLENSAANTGDAVGDTFVSIENIAGSLYADTITGDGNDNAVWARAGNDYVEGGAGNDNLYGDAGNDSLIGGAGDDMLTGGAGADVLSGGAGYDTVSYINSPAGITLTSTSWGNLVATGGDAQGDEVLGSASNADVGYIERFIGSSYDDYLMAGDYGYGSGSTAITLDGGAGNDHLYESGGSYGVMLGGDGNDVLQVWHNITTMTGGAGADTFRFIAMNGSVNPGSTITDFNSGSDKIDLTGSDAKESTTSSSGGMDHFVWRGEQAETYHEWGALSYYKVDNPGSANDYTNIKCDVFEIRGFNIAVAGLHDFSTADFLL